MPTLCLNTLQSTLVATHAAYVSLWVLVHNTIAVHALGISPELTAIAHHSRAVRVFVYDFPSHVQPELEQFAPDSPLCRKSSASQTWHTFGIDLCNYGLGVVETGASPVATSAYQGNVWSNHENGQGIAHFVHARLAWSPRRVKAAAEADVFFIPFYSRQVSRGRTKYSGMEHIDFSPYTVDNFWEWMLEQPSFLDSDGSDHFMILSFTLHSVRSFATCGILLAALPEGFFAVSLPWITGCVTNDRRPGHNRSAMQRVLLSKEAAVAALGADRAAVLDAKLQKMHYIVHSDPTTVDEETARFPNGHVSPYGTHYHYVPTELPPSGYTARRSLSQSGRRVRTVHDSAELRRHPWQPSAIIERPRPIQSAYLGGRRITQTEGVIEEKKAVAAECAGGDECFLLDVEDIPGSLARFANRPGVVDACTTLGYKDAFECTEAIMKQPDLIYAFATFCLTPHGDAPTRRGFFDALLMGCIPVVFDEKVRNFPWFFTPQELDETTLLLPGEAARDWALLEPLLRAAEARAPTMRAAIAKQVTRLTYAVADLTAEQHAEVGPDAIDMILWRLTEHRNLTDVRGSSR